MTNQYCAMKTEKKLKEEWGIERFVEALAFLSGWYQSYGAPSTQDEMMKLHDENIDAFNVFVARTLCPA